ncbi:MAG TPA: DNA-deoxyinosine glycosylase [Methanoregulaceae archaeon]|nr:DNA-deoxyinosine glycosylase [Methanoregulaceae archaeon]
MPNHPRREYGLDPILGKEPKVLILGSFPSKMSLEQKLYYANPRNHFWKIMTVLLKIPQKNNIEENTRLLEEHHIAVWDVIASRKFQEGAMDRDIRDARLNNIAGFIRQNQTIRFIGINGGKAWQCFRKAMQDDPLPKTPAARRLPSTSPANARYSLDEKIRAWRVILEYLE